LLLLLFYLETCQCHLVTNDPNNISAAAALIYYTPCQCHLVAQLPCHAA